MYRRQHRRKPPRTLAPQIPTVRRALPSARHAAKQLAARQRFELREEKRARRIYEGDVGHLSYDPYDWPAPEQPPKPLSLDCVGDRSGGTLGQRCRVMSFEPVDRKSHLVIFDDDQCVTGDAVDIPYRRYYDVDHGRVVEFGLYLSLNRRRTRRR